MIRIKDYTERDFQAFKKMALKIPSDFFRYNF